MSEIPRLSRAAVVDACRYFDGWLAFQRHHLRVPGVQAAVLHADPAGSELAGSELAGSEVVLSTAHGTASLETGEPLTERHLFRIASHSKTFTATAVMQLAERGVLRLDDTVAAWVPALATAPIAAVTLRELLSHSGGVVRDSWDGDFWQLQRAFPDAEGLLQMASDASAVLARNERFKYSNVGYSVLGLVIEAATGTSYHDHVVEHVVRPLGLHDTGPEFDPARAAEYAAGHSALSYADRRVVIDHIDTHAMAAATGFFSTAADVVRYASAHFPGDDRLLSDDSKRQMQRTEWEVEGAGSSYGLGFAIQTVAGRRVLGHGGGYPGHITRTFFDPVDRLAVSVLTNSIDGPALGWATAFLSLVGVAAAGPGAAPDGVDLQRYCGRFATLWGVYDVVALGGRLLQMDPTAPDPTALASHLEVVDDTTLRIARTNGYGSPGERLAYRFADDGSVASVRGGSGSTAVAYDEYRRSFASIDRVRLGDPVTDGGGLRD